jgi:cytochrome c biogenesis protein CcdA
VSSSHVSESLRKSARLRAQVEQLERNALQRWSLARRVWAFITGVLTTFVVLVLVTDGLFAYHVFS